MTDWADKAASEIILDIDADWTWDGRVHSRHSEFDAHTAIATALRAARAEGIEAAAKVAEGVTDYSDSLQRASGCLTAGERAALAIRALLTKESGDAGT